MNAVDYPHPDDLPIPEDVQVGMGWTGQMIEMADHIGAYATLRVIDRFGGQYLYIPADPARNVFAEVIGTDKAAIVSHVYGRERIHVPVGKAALRSARRQGVIAAVRAGVLTSTAAAKMLRTSQTYMWHLVNRTDEGKLSAPTPRPAIRDARQMDMFDE